MDSESIETLLAVIIEGHARKGSTLLVGVTGGVAVGKSTFSQEVARLLGEDTGLEVEVVASDGFLHSNATLAERGLSDRKGFPESFDSVAISNFLNAVRSGLEASVPVYDHLTYDVLDQHREVGPIDVLIFEGVNVLQFHHELDLGIYLHAEEPLMRHWFIERTLRFREAARTEFSPFFDPWLEVPDELFLEMVTIAWESVNLPNLLEAIEPTRSLAHVVIEWEADHRVRTLTLQENS